MKNTININVIQQVKLNAEKINSLSDIKKHHRLFYELGHYEGKKWIREGVFKEIYDVENFIKIDKRMSKKEFIEHHNFVILS